MTVMAMFLVLLVAMGGRRETRCPVGICSGGMATTMVAAGGVMFFMFLFLLVPVEVDH